MGTHCLTVVKQEGKEEDIIVMYRQEKGYPGGHGLELAESFGNIIIENGKLFKRTKDDNNKYANGMNCLSAQIVGHFKVA